MSNNSIEIRLTLKTHKGLNIKDFFALFLASFSVAMRFSIIIAMN
jgi:hypothetical protein